MAFFVTYYTKSPEGVEALPTNIILKETHPVIWATNPSDIARELKHTTILMFWEEVPDYLLNYIGNWCEIED